MFTATLNSFESFLATLIPAGLLEFPGAGSMGSGLLKSGAVSLPAVSGGTVGACREIEALDDLLGGGVRIDEQELLGLVDLGCFRRWFLKFGIIKDLPVATSPLFIMKPEISRVIARAKSMKPRQLNCGS
jgi:hypothetical protein